jgi:hypothetical protein
MEECVPPDLRLRDYACLNTDLFALHYNLVLVPHGTLETGNTWLCTLLVDTIIILNFPIINGC